MSRRVSLFGQVREASMRAITHSRDGQSTVRRAGLFAPPQGEESSGGGADEGSKMKFVLGIDRLGDETREL